MQMVTYQKYQDSWPMLLAQSARYSAVPPKIETVTAYGNATPRARISVGKSSAFTTALMDVYPLTATSAAMSNVYAMASVRAPARAVSSGTVPNRPRTPNAM